MIRIFLQLVLVYVAIISLASTSIAAPQGDINQDDVISIEDAILGLQVLAGESPSIPEFVEGLDVNGDSLLGLAEILNTLMLISEYGEFGIVTSPTGRVWMDRNLGASRVATSSTDTEAYGDLYQWGRGTDGHEERDSETTSTLSPDLDTPGHDNFITVTNSPYDWRTPQNENLWQGVNGLNNPCPVGFRLPTNIELEAEVASWSNSNSAGAYESVLKLVVGGYRHHSPDAPVNAAGSSGFYWSSTVVSVYSQVLGLNSDNAVMLNNNRGVGFSVRCIKD